MTEPHPLETLLPAIADGDEAAFQELYTATSAQLFAVILRIVIRRALAEEVLQEVFLAIWDHAGDFRPDRGLPLSWMMAIARNRALDKRRRFRPESALDAVEGRDQWADPDPGPLDWAIAGAEARRLHGCLEALEAKQRDCILMAMCEGYTHSELAARTETPLGTVKSWIRRGLRQLRDCLE